MGHKDIQTTLDIYADVTEATKQTAITKLANDLDGLLQSYYNLGLLKGKFTSLIFREQSSDILMPVANSSSATAIFLRAFFRI